MGFRQSAALCLFSAAAVVAGVSASALAIDASNVLVLYNADSQDGVDIQSYYSQLYPEARSFAIDLGVVGEEVSANYYLDSIRPPVLAELDRLASQGVRIDCIVTTKGLPLRIDNPGSGSNWKRYSSLESELTRIDTIDSIELMGNQGWYMPASWGGNPLAQNPYFRQEGVFSHDEYGTRLTSRLDGFSAADVQGALNRDQLAVHDHPGYTFLIDDDPDKSYDRMERLRDNVLEPLDVPYVYDGTGEFITSADGQVLGYVSHGVHGGAPGNYVSNTLDFDAAKGAVFLTWESFNAYTFEKDNISDMPGRQGLVAEWIERGGTAGVGNVQEPGASDTNVTQEDRLFELLLDGYTFVEAAWNATNQLSYVNTVVGDPLMRWEAWILGDANLDGVVDIHDINTVKSSYGTSFGDDGYSFLADLDSDGVVGAADLSVAKSAFLNATNTNATVVPEPATVGLLALGAVTLIRRRRIA